MSAHASAPNPMNQWVEQLHWPQTRRVARQRLVAARAVDCLLDCLQSTNESVVWAAVVSLGELRAAEAVEPLIELLERGILEMDVGDALSQITGKNAGTDARKWRKTVGPNAAASTLNVADCVARTADYLGVKPVGSGDSYRFKLSLPNDRSQNVAVFFGRRDAEGHDLVVIYSECGPASPKYYESVLRKNLSMPFGAFAVRDINGTPNFVVVQSIAASVATPGTLARNIEQIAAQADQVEKQLTQEDQR